MSVFGLQWCGWGRGLRVVGLDSLCRWQVQVSVYCAWRIPAHRRCTQYLFIADIANPDLFVCVCRIWICLNITHFYEVQCQPFSGSAWVHNRHDEARITDKTKITTPHIPTTLHYITTQQTTPRCKKHTTTQTTPQTITQTPTP